LRKSVFLHAIAFELGVAKPIAGIGSVAIREGVIDNFLRNGLRDYRETESTPVQLATSCIVRTMALAGLLPDQIDALIYASNSFSEPGRFAREISQAMSELGLWRLAPIGVTMSECANFATALRIAHGLVASEGLKRVILVTTDVCPTDDARLVPSVTVLSDGAASCLVTDEHVEGFEILAMEHAANHQLRAIDPERESIRMFRSTAAEIRRCAGRALARCSMQPDQLTALVFNNLSRSVLQLYAAQCQVDWSRVYANVAEMGHVYAADALINLDGARRSRGYEGAVFMLVVNGICCWGSIILAVTDARCKDKVMVDGPSVGNGAPS
jgi:3-oxoacyl-[acyl-carrier-protein] synthase-3